LRATAEQVRERRFPRLGVERVISLDAYPGQCLATTRELIAAAGKFLLGLQQLEASLEPLVTGSDWMCHEFFL
jgi:hypothetical protein